jgi:chromosome segregation ATPase
LLKDTKSSNGTYLNGIRLSNPAEESSEHEIFSGDLIKFGVDIVEESDAASSSKGHVCPPVVTTVTLFHPDGSQALRKPWERHGFDHKVVSVSSEQLLCLAYHVELAQKRQVQLQTKLRCLEAQLVIAEDRVQQGWQSVVTEDMLLSKVESLQTRLQGVLMSAVPSSKAGRNKVSLSNKENEAVGVLRDNFLEIQAQKEVYEENAKKTIQSLYEERLEQQERISKAESRLSTAENECKRLKTLIEELQTAIDRSNERVCDQQQQIADGKKKQMESSEKLIQVNLDKMNLEQKLVEFQSKETQLSEQLQELHVELEAKQLQLNVFLKSMSKGGSLFDSFMKDSQEESKLEPQLSAFAAGSPSRSPTDQCTSHLSELELIKSKFF